MGNKKYALLDTDFISKMHLIRKDDQHKLIDKVMEMPGYTFFCHEQIRKEILRHNIGGAPKWLEDRIDDNSICLYDDKKILEELSEMFGQLALTAYTQMMKKACDAYEQGYYDEKFVEISGLDCSNVTQSEFLEKLKSDSDSIGGGQNLGEIKTYVLLQTLNMKLGQQIYVFCSDDKNARNGVVSLGNVKCISVLSSFLRLQKETGFTREDAEPYIQSYMSTCLGKDQTTFRIQDTSKEKRMCKVPCMQVFDEMFSGKIKELKTGSLKYIQ